MKVDFKSLAVEILRIFRGEHSLTEMDRILNSGERQYGRWESGRVEIKWEDFVFVCRKLKLPLRDSLNGTIGYRGNPYHYQSIIETACGSVGITVLAKNMNVSRFTVRRWVKAAASPTLCQMLEIIHQSSTKVSVFLKTLVDLRRSVLIRNYVNNYEATLVIIQEMPWISGVLSVLDLDDYKRKPHHDAAWVAERSRLSRALLEKTLTFLEQTGLVEFIDHHYVSTANDIDPALLRQKAKNLMSYWMRRNSEAVNLNYPSPERRSLSSFHIFNVNAETADEIKKLYVDFTKELALYVTRGQKNSSQIYSFTLSMINLSDMPIQKDP